MLGAEDGAWAAGLLSVTGAGTFEHGSSTLQLRSDPEPSEQDRWRSVRTRLAAARAGRPQPGRDDKVVAAWNGLAIAALAEAGALLAEPSYLDAAVAAATLLLDVHLVDGRLRRTSRDGRVGANAGVLEDYADVAEGLLALHQATGAARWLAAAGDLLDVVLARFGDGDGGFFDTADDAEKLVRRPWDATDGPAPCGPAAAAGALLSYAALTGRTGAPGRGRGGAGRARPGRRALPARRRLGLRYGRGRAHRPAAGRHRPARSGRRRRVDPGRPARDQPGPGGGGRGTGHSRRAAAGRPAADRWRADGVRLPRVRL